MQSMVTWQGANMSDQTKSSRPVTIVILLVAALFLLPCYVLSIGPAVWLVDHHYLSNETAEAVYWPITTSMRYCPPLERAMYWYGSFFSHPRGP